MAQAVLATDAPADDRPDCPSHQADCPPHHADCLSPPQRGKREHLHAAVAGHVSVPEAMPRTPRLQAHSPDEGGNQPDERGNQDGHQQERPLLAQPAPLPRPLLVRTDNIGVVQVGL